MGAGSWGTATAKVLVDAGTESTIWARRAELADQINTEHTNNDYLSGITLPAGLRASNSYAELLAEADIVVCAVPSQSLRDNLARWTPHLRPDATLVSLAKGVETSSLMRMSEVIAEVTGFGSDQVAVLTGPNLAREIAEGQPAATVIACADEDRAKELQSCFATGYFRPYSNTDVVGCEIGGAVKNVIALAVGMAEGMGLGDNTKSSIITRGLAEMTRLGVALGADARTFAGLAGVGDLIATCMSPLSRNHSFGVKLGEGLSVAQVTEVTKQTAEGVKSCASILDLARAHGVDVPITEMVNRVVHEDFAPADMVEVLLARARKHETE